MVGYKQTDIGRIPVDWDVLPFTDIAELKHGFQFQEEHFSKSGIGVVKIGTLTNSAGLDLTSLTFTHNHNIKRFRKFELNKGDILMALTGATLGKVAKVDTDRTLLQNYRVGNFIPNNKTTRLYLYHVSQSFLIQQMVKYLVNEAAQPNLGKADFDKILIPLPPLSEQQAIAEVLSDTDELITALEKKIAKKKLIKKGAMQELLTPKDDWEVKKLGEVCDIKKGQLITSDTKTDGIIPVIAGGKKPAYYHNESNRNGKQITVSSSGANAGFVSFHNYPIFASDCSTIGESKKYKIEYIYYLLLLFQQEIYNRQAGGAQPHIHPSDISPIEIPFPPIQEQTSISTILSKMDAEINALENKLSKTKTLKQALMQQLLTGKIRLVD